MAGDGPPSSSSSATRREGCPVIGGNGGKSSSLPLLGGRGVNGNEDRTPKAPSISRGNESVGENVAGISSSPVYTGMTLRMGGKDGVDERIDTTGNAPVSSRSIAGDAKG